MAKNTDLHRGKTNKKDEFYTTIEDIEKEMFYHKNCFKNKTVYCNCDDYKTSNFWRFFHVNFSKLGLTKLIATYYNENGCVKAEYFGGNDYDCEACVKSPLVGDGDFRSDECLSILNDSDIIVTNPPFSLFRDFMRVLTLNKKLFVIIGNINSVSCKEIFPLIRDGYMRIGDSIHAGDVKFYVPQDYPLNASTCGVDTNGKRFIRVKGVRWFTNIDDYQNKPIELLEKYQPEKHLKFDNYNAINVDYTKDIPCDYFGIMGVPLTFLDKYCPSQFKIIGHTHTSDVSPEVEKIRTNPSKRHRGLVNGIEKYERILIQRA